MATKKRESLADALAATPAAKQHTGGAGCQTCAFEKSAKVDAESRRWNELRRKNKTRAPWSMFHAVLVRELGYPVRSWKSLVAHLRRCRGWTIH